MLKFAKSNRFEKYEIHLLEHGKEKGLYRKLKKKKKKRKKNCRYLRRRYLSSIGPISVYITSRRKEMMHTVLSEKTFNKIQFSCKNVDLPITFTQMTVHY